MSSFLLLLWVLEAGRRQGGKARHGGKEAYNRGERREREAGRQGSCMEGNHSGERRARVGGRRARRGSDKIESSLSALALKLVVVMHVARTTLPEMHLPGYLSLGQPL